ncbi:hypothetical protein HZD82_24280, partial [Pantoea agglomerans]|nr:hypothetical protein [Pantoea agglomerans]
SHHDVGLTKLSAARGGECTDFITKARMRLFTDCVCELSRRTKQHPGVSWIDRKSGYDSLFSFWRTLLSGLLALALLLITL